MVQIEDYKNKNYRMNFDKEKVNGYLDEINAMPQVIYKILNTQRYKYNIYSWNYGVELDDLIGNNATYVCSEIERRVSEALLQDDRIKKVEDFYYDTSIRGIVATSFTVKTIFGNIKIDTEIKY